MDLRAKLVKMFGEIQESSSCHQRYITILVDSYKSMTCEEFFPPFMNIIRRLLKCKIFNENLRLDRCMKFLTGFITRLADNQNEDDDETHPLLKQTINEVLKYTSSPQDEHRYHACKFINTLLDTLSEDAYIDSDICEAIQEALLLCLRDVKPSIRFIALKGLYRLQDPSIECPIISSFMNALKDSDFKVRKNAIEYIAASLNTLPRMIQKLRDANPKVRSATFKRLAGVNVRSLKIEDRRNVLYAGFSEIEKTSKNIFEEVLISKWLGFFDGDFLKFINGIKFDADECDVESTAVITKNLMKIFFKKYDIKDIINSLPLGEDKLVPIDKLSNETILFWNNLQIYIIENKEHADYLDTIVPELTIFSKYILKYLQENVNKNYEYWEFLEHQFVVQKMFEMAGRFDFSDEVGKQNLKNLVHKYLEEFKTVESITDVLIKILDRIYNNADTLQENVIDIISNLKGENIVEVFNEEDLQDWRFKLAEIKMKINVTSENMEDAIREREFKKVLEFEKSLQELKEQLRLLEENRPGSGKKKVTLSEDLIVSKSLDILNALLQLASVKTLNVMVKAQVNEFINLLSDSNNVEVYRKVFRLIALAATCDQTIALEYWKTICSPIKMYRVMPYSKEELMFISLPAFADLVRIYGPSIFSNEDNENTNKRSGKIRRLYNIADFNETDSILHDYYNCDDMIEILTDILDDESTDMREKAGEAISKLVYNEILVSSGILSRIMIKSCFPVFAEHNPKTQQLFLHATFKYCANSKNIETVERAVESVLASIMTHEKSSPISEFDIDNIIKYLISVTSQMNSEEPYLIHKKLAYTFCNIIANNTHEKSAVIYAKFLLNLTIPNKTSVIIELKEQASKILEIAQEKTLRVRLNRYIANLLLVLQKCEESLQSKSENTTTNSSIPANSTVNSKLKLTQLESIPEEQETNANEKMNVDANLENIENVNNTIEDISKVKRKKQNTSDDSEDDLNESDKQIKPDESKHTNKKIKILNTIVINNKKSSDTKRKDALKATKIPIVKILRSPKIAKLLETRKSNEENLSGDSNPTTVKKITGKTEIPLKPRNLNQTIPSKNTKNQRKTRSVTNEFKSRLEDVSEIDDQLLNLLTKTNVRAQNTNKKKTINKNNSSLTDLSSNESFNIKIKKFKQNSRSLKSSEHTLSRKLRTTSNSSNNTSQDTPLNGSKNNLLRSEKSIPCSPSSSGSSEEFCTSKLKSVVKNIKLLRTSPRKSLPKTPNQKSVNKRKASPTSPEIKRKTRRTKSPESVISLSSTEGTSTKKKLNKTSPKKHRTLIDSKLNVILKKPRLPFDSSSNSDSSSPKSKSLLVQPSKSKILNRPLRYSLKIAQHSKPKNIIRKSEGNKIKYYSFINNVDKLLDFVEKQSKVSPEKDKKPTVSNNSTPTKKKLKMGRNNSNLSMSTRSSSSLSSKSLRSRVNGKLHKSNLREKRK